MSLKTGSGWSLFLLLQVIALGSIFYFDTFWIYIALFLWVLMSSVFFLSKNKIPIISIKVITDYVPVLMVSSWLYGVFLGLALGTNFELVFRNYFGMIFYALYPLLLFFLKTRRDVMGFIWNCAVISGIILFFSIALEIYRWISNLEVFSLKLLVFEELGMMAFRFHYAANSFFFLAAIAMAHRFKRKEVSIPKFRVNLIIIWLLILYIVSFSKGFILALIPFFIIILLMKRSELNYFTILFLLLLIIFSIAFIYESNNELLAILLNDELNDTSPRNVQLKELINDISFFGHGLGASLENSSYVRDSNFGYSFELTYVNLVHKLGVFSFLVFLAFALTLFKGVGMLLSSHSESILSGAVVLTLMLYLVVSWGNPIMFNPICVISHMLALALIRKKDIKTSILLKHKLSPPLYIP